MEGNDVKENQNPIVLDGKDICRIIPFGQEGGKYEFKVDFLDNEFDIYYYKLFSKEPIRVEINDSCNKEITYHKGNHGKPVKIHIKDKLTNKYELLPIQRIQAPDVNHLFPIPIMKLEIPTDKNVREFKPKSYYKTIPIEGCNVIELFIANTRFDYEMLNKKYQGLLLHS